MKTYGKNSNVASTVLRSVIRDEIGHLRVRQCMSKLHEKRVASRHVIEFNAKTKGDILNKLQYANLLRSIVRPK